jgi:SAM-dependent methyltransferase
MKSTIIPLPVLEKLYKPPQTHLCFFILNPSTLPFLLVINPKYNQTSIYIYLYTTTLNQPTTMSPPATQEWANLFKSKDFARSYRLAEQLTGLFADPLIDQSRITSCQPGNPPIVLDNACGTGIISSVLNGRLSDHVRQNWKLTCGDFSEGMVEYTKQRAIDEGWRNAEVKVVDAQETNLSSDHYTHVLASFGEIKLQEASSI